MIKKLDIFTLYSSNLSKFLTIFHFKFNICEKNKMLKTKIKQTFFETLMFLAFYEIFFEKKLTKQLLYLQ